MKLQNKEKKVNLTKKKAFNNNVALNAFLIRMIFSQIYLFFDIFQCTKNLKIFKNDALKNL